MNPVVINKPKDKQKTVTVAKVSGKDIKIATPQPAGVFLSFMEKATTDEMGATIELLRRTLGDDQYEVVKNAEGLEYEHLVALASNILEVITGVE